MLTLLGALTLLGIFRNGFCSNELSITNASELVEFSRKVNSGTNYTGTTILLDSDIDFGEEEEALSQQFEPIGMNYDIYFQGTFDGQGHVIKNLKINSTFQSVGLFGYIIGTTIQNIVFDESCSVMNTFNPNAYFVYTGSILGYCGADNGPCTIENSVNMAEVTFSESQTKASRIGGIAGVLLFTSNYNVSIRNCVNYGTVKNIGSSGTDVTIGGLVGYSQVSSITYPYAQNCANYGSLIFDGTANVLHIGGISGSSEYGKIENCVSSGKIVVSPSSKTTGKTYIGSIVGYVESSVITHSLWTRDVGFNDPVGYKSSSTKVTNSSFIEQLNATTRRELNDYANSKNELEKWTLLHLNGGRINNLTQDALVVVQKGFPDPVKEENSFVQWCTDNECSGVFDQSQGSTGTTDLYAAWLPNNYTVFFDLGNGTTIEEVFAFNSQIIYPENLEKDRYTFNGWSNNVITMPAENITITALWVLNNYTVTFDLGNGTTIEEVFPFNNSIKYPENVEKEGHTFNGWNNDVKMMPAENITITALWIPNNYTVTFDLGNGTIIKEVFQFNNSIEYPENVEKDGCTFNGWNKNVTTMPAKDITIAVSWNCTHSSSSSTFLPVDEDKSSKSNTGAIVGGVVGGIAGVAIVIFLVLMFLFFMKKKSNDDESRMYKNSIEMKQDNPRIVTKHLDDLDDKDCDDATIASIGESIGRLYSDRYKIPTIAEALKTAGVDDDRANLVVDSCGLGGMSAEAKGKLFEGFTKEDAAGVALYTFDFGGTDFELNPYRIINRALASNDEAELRRASGLLFVVMSSLRKLPKATGRTLYRGVRGDVDVSLYKEGRTIVWRGLSSTSPDMGATKAFLAKNSESGNAKGILFVIENGWGYDVQPYSLFPDEAEILLEPGRRFRVVSVIVAELTAINLRMLDTPVLLPEVFGENKN